MQVAVERTEGSDNLLSRAQFLCLFLQLFFLLLKRLVILVGLAHNFEHVIQSERSVGSNVIRIGQITYELNRFVQSVSVRIDFYERPKVIHSLKL